MLNSECGELDVTRSANSSFVGTNQEGLRTLLMRFLFTMLVVYERKA